MNRRYKNVPEETLAHCIGIWDSAAYELECRANDYARIIKHHSISEATRQSYADRMTEALDLRDGMVIDVHDMVTECAYRGLQPVFRSLEGDVVLRAVK